MGGGGSPFRAVLNAVTAPIKAVGAAAIAPVKAGINIAQGKNVVQSLADSGGSVLKAGVSLATEPAAIVNATPVLGKVANAVTGNFFGSETTFGNDLQNVVTGGSAPNFGSDAVNFAKGSAIVGAEVLTGGAAAGALGTAGAIGAGLGAGSLSGKLLSGNASAGDVVNAAADFSGDPTLGDASGFLNDLGPMIDPGAPRLGAGLPQASSQGPFYIGPGADPAQSSFSPALVLIPVAIAGAVFLFMKRRR